MYTNTTSNTTTNTLFSNADHRTCRTSLILVPYHQVQVPTVLSYELVPGSGVKRTQHMFMFPISNSLWYHGPAMCADATFPTYRACDGCRQSLTLGCLMSLERFPHLEMTLPTKSRYRMLILLLVCFASVQVQVEAAFPKRICEYNIWDGAFSKPGRPSWLLPLWGSGEKPVPGGLTEYAKENPFDVLGVTEAKTWINGSSTIAKPATAVIAAAWGYQFSELVAFPGDPYHLAFMATSPIEVLEGLKKNFAHSGAIAKIDGVVYILCQLNPFDSRARETEAKIIKEKAEYYTTAGYPVVVFGDFNSLSPQDGEAGLHKEYNCSCPNKSCEWACKDGAIDYDPVKIILSANLTDMCWVDTNMFTCQGSYPTEVYSQPYSAVRIDYILANEMFLANWTKNNGPPPGATVVKTNETEHTSDHYPIQLVA